MRTALHLGRTCLRQQPSVILRCVARRETTRSLSTRCNTAWRSFGKAPERASGSPVLLFSALSPAAFVALSEEDDADGKTPEQHMLEASRAEISKAIPENVHGLKKAFRAIVLAFDIYLFEPIATALRFLHLVIIFVPVIGTMPLVFIGPRQKDHDNERSGTLWWYWFLVKSMESAGPAFIKLGQWAASRQDIFPEEMCSTMSSLHSDAPAHSLRHTKETIIRAFDGRPFDEIFEEFQEKPLGVGAIAQVYKAKLKPDLAAPGDIDIEDYQNTPNIRQQVRKNVDALVKSTPSRVPSSYVAIKVLHPKVERMVRRDLRIMSIFAAVINAIPTLEWFDLPKEIDQFGEMMRLQLDLRIEAANLTMFRKKFKNRTTAWFPFPYADYTTRQVLVEEFAQGIPLAHFLEDGGGVFQKEIADEGLDAFLHMLLIDNFVHADLHPGNIMVRFYKPQQVDLSFGRHRQSDDPEQSTDVTEEVLAQLRPHRHHSSAWLAELDTIEKEGYRPQLIFIDTGLVTALNATNRRNFLDLFKAIAEFDGYRAGHLMVERCRQPEVVLDPEIFALKMQHLVLGVKSKTFALGNIKIGDVLNEVLGMVRQHHVRMEGDFVNVVISILLLEGIGRTLDPSLDLFKRYAAKSSPPVPSFYANQTGNSALPILRQLGGQERGSTLLRNVREGDTSMLKVWIGLEARRFLQASAEQVDVCVKSDLLSPNI